MDLRPGIMQKADPPPTAALHTHTHTSLHLLTSDCPGEPKSFSIFLTNAFRSISFASAQALSRIANGPFLIASATALRLVRTLPLDDRVSLGSGDFSCSICLRAAVRVISAIPCGYSRTSCMYTCAV